MCLQATNRIAARRESPASGNFLNFDPDIESPPDLWSIERELYTWVDGKECQSDREQYANDSVDNFDVHNVDRKGEED